MQDEFRFVYTRGFEAAQRDAGMPFIIGFPSTDRVYRSSELFPIFRNRTMNPSRPDYPAYLSSMALAGPVDFMEELARTGGVRTTDTFKVYPGVESERGRDGEQYRVVFFVHGLRHMPKSARERARRLGVDEDLYLMWDAQNEHDANAIAVRTADCFVVGYVPRYHSSALVQLLKRGVDIQVRVEQTSADPTPWTRTLLCTAQAPWPDGLELLDEEHTPLVSERHEARADATD